MSGQRRPSRSNSAESTGEAATSCSPCVTAAVSLFCYQDEAIAATVADPAPRVIKDPEITELFGDVNVDNSSDYAMIARTAKEEQATRRKSLTPFDMRPIMADVDTIVTKADEASKRRSSRGSFSHPGSTSPGVSSPSRRKSRGNKGRRRSTQVRSREGSLDRGARRKSSAPDIHQSSLSESSKKRKGSGKGRKLRDRRRHSVEDRSAGTSVPELPPQSPPAEVIVSPACTICQQNAYEGNLEFATFCQPVAPAAYAANYCYNNDTSYGVTAPMVGGDGLVPALSVPAVTRWGLDSSAKSLPVKSGAKRHYRKKTAKVGDKRRTSTTIEETASSEAIELLGNNHSSPVIGDGPPPTVAASAFPAMQPPVRQYRSDETSRPASVVAMPQQPLRPWTPHPLCPVHSLPPPADERPSIAAMHGLRASNPSIAAQNFSWRTDPPQHGQTHPGPAAHVPCGGLWGAPPACAPHPGPFAAPPPLDAWGYPAWEQQFARGAPSWPSLPPPSPAPPPPPPPPEQPYGPVWYTSCPPGPYEYGGQFAGGGWNPGWQPLPMQPMSPGAACFTVNSAAGTDTYSVSSDPLAPCPPQSFPTTPGLQAQTHLSHRQIGQDPPLPQRRKSPAPMPSYPWFKFPKLPDYLDDFLRWGRTATECPDAGFASPPEPEELKIAWRTVNNSEGFAWSSKEEKAPARRFSACSLQERRPSRSSSEGNFGRLHSYSAPYTDRRKSSAREDETARERLSRRRHSTCSGRMSAFDNGDSPPSRRSSLQNPTDERVQKRDVSLQTKLSARRVAKCSPCHRPDSAACCRCLVGSPVCPCHCGCHSPCPCLHFPSSSVHAICAAGRSRSCHMRGHAQRAPSLENAAWVPCSTTCPMYATAVCSHERIGGPPRIRIKHVRSQTRRRPLPHGASSSQVAGNVAMTVSRSSSGVQPWYRKRMAGDMYIVLPGRSGREEVYQARPLSPVIRMRKSRSQREAKSGRHRSSARRTVLHAATRTDVAKRPMLRRCSQAGFLSLSGQPTQGVQQFQRKYDDKESHLELDSAALASRRRKSSLKAFEQLPRDKKQELNYSNISSRKPSIRTATIEGTTLKALEAKAPGKEPNDSSRVSKISSRMPSVEPATIYMTTSRVSNQDRRSLDSASDIREAEDATRKHINELMELERSLLSTKTSQKGSVTLKRLSLAPSQRPTEEPEQSNLSEETDPSKKERDTRRGSTGSGKDRDHASNIVPAEGSRATEISKRLSRDSTQSGQHRMAHTRKSVAGSLPDDGQEEATGGAERTGTLSGRQSSGTKEAEPAEEVTGSGTAEETGRELESTPPRVAEKSSLEDKQTLNAEVRKKPDPTPFMSLYLEILLAIAIGVACVCWIIFVYIASGPLVFHGYITQGETVSTVLLISPTTNFVPYRRAKDKDTRTGSDSLQQVYLCDTDLCKHEGERLKRYTIEHISPCENFYRYACQAWEEKFSVSRLEGGAAISVDTEVEDSLAASLRDYILNARNSEVTLIRDLYKACLRPTGDPSLDLRKQVFDKLPIPFWLYNYSSADPLRIWRLAGMLVRRYGIVSILEVTVGVRYYGNEPTVELTYPRHLHLSENYADEEYLKTLHDAIREAALLFGGEATVQPLTSQVVSVAKNLALISDDGKAWQVLVGKRDAFGDNVRAFLRSVFKGDVVTDTPVLIRNPRLIIDKLQRLTSTAGTTDFVNYLGFLVLVHFSAFLHPEESKNLRRILGHQMTGRAFSSDQDWLLCLRVIDSALPACLIKAQAMQQVAARAHVTNRIWLGRLEDLFYRHLPRIAWMTNRSIKVLADKLKRHEVGRFFVSSLPEHLCAVASTSAATEGGSMGMFVRSAGIYQLERLHAVTKRERPSDGGHAISTNSRYSVAQKAVYVPVGVLKGPLLEYSTLRAFHASRTAVRVYKGLLPLLYEQWDSNEDDEVREVLGRWSRFRLAKLLNCTERDWREVHSQLEASHVFDRLPDISELRYPLLAQTAALALAYAAFKDLLDVKRIWGYDFRLAPLANLSSEKLFFLYYAMDNCELSDALYRARQLRTWGQLPPELRVNFPLRHLPQFARAFDCSPAQWDTTHLMVASKGSRCDILRWNMGVNRDLRNLFGLRDGDGFGAPFAYVDTVSLANATNGGEMTFAR